ncbi:hypothetical protein PIB30_075520 [Stylosanthes scabra]|uniref:Reverse transcriptase zinc-binding domain-containing protein n=1 Tax=Stylosanthes scabra TaxID=79078 RepID=A0ABU6YMI4_9FABA|nr:hypothetical protein [Stylosanthes scabra]
MFAWFFLTGGVSTKDSLRRRNIIPQGDGVCVMCGAETKTINRLFVHYSYISKLWWLCCCWGRVVWVGNSEIMPGLRDRLIKSKDSFAFGGYVTNERKQVRCWFGELINTKMGEEEYVEVLEIGIHFMLEEMGVVQKEIMDKEYKEKNQWVTKAEAGETCHGLNGPGCGVADPAFVQEFSCKPGMRLLGEGDEKWNC